jgi:hypothetical protein
MFLNKAGLHKIVPVNMQVRLQFQIAANTLAYLANSKITNKKVFNIGLSQSVESID